MNKDNYQLLMNKIYLRMLTVTQRKHDIVLKYKTV